ncbi:glycosyltransferase [Vibrio rhizosphaerae]|uniref:glycosyltransferase n=1 Tax=Vibrio rhizosphaerae TaxID=398736 RepID=UPI000691158D|nr:glycosyltransferase [Vibrio rhizosphaerae]
MKISVLICTYNPNQYFENLLDSILRQSITVDNIYIYDDSIDAVNINYIEKIIKKLSEKYSFNNIVHRHGTRKGVVSNFLYSISELHDYDWLFLADQDDIWEENKVELYLERMDECNNPDEPCMIFSDSLLIDEHNKSLGYTLCQLQKFSNNFLQDDSILYRNCVQGATICMNCALSNVVKESLAKVNIEDILMHDWWISLFAKYEGKYLFIDKPMLRYRQHSSNIVGAISKFDQVCRFVSNPFSFHVMMKKIVKQKKIFNAIININNRNFIFNEVGILKKILIKLYDRD